MKPNTGTILRVVIYCRLQPTGAEIHTIDQGLDAEPLADFIEEASADVFDQLRGAATPSTPA